MANTKPATFAVVTLLLALQAAAKEQSPTAIGRKIESFSLADFRGKSWSLVDVRQQQVVVVAFLGTECPLVRLYSQRLAELHEKYGDRGVAFVGINANRHDSITEMAHFARVYKIPFPLLKDAGNRVADQFQAERTPEIFVLDAERKVRYHGRIDDQYTYGIARPKKTQDYLVAALDALLDGKPVETPETETVGCHIGRVLDPDPDSDVTYSQQISRILQKRCVQCHRPGELAPFALTNYDEVVGWAEMIDEVVREQRMPPWHASPEHGEFSNDARLNEDEKQLIYRWVKAGAPQGDPRQLPTPRTFTPGWQIGKPDVEIFMADGPFHVPATGEVEYKYFVVDPGWKEDKWIKAAECRPGNRSVVHHIIVAARAPSGGRATAHGLESDWIVATAPGAQPLMLSDGMAKLVPAGSKLVFQMHYTPNGTAQDDRSSVGFIFADPKEVRRPVATHKAANGGIKILPHRANQRFRAQYTFKQDSLMLHMFPHMHLRGQSFKYTAIYPDGSDEVLLDIPRYDFNWQNSYAFVEPKPMPRGTKIECVALFDNSEDNLANPDPSATVRWGDQTWDEMMIGYFDIAPAETIKVETVGRVDSGKAAFLEAVEQGRVKVEAKLVRLARSALESQQSFERFGVELRRLVPQVHRVCWTTVGDGKLHVRLAAQDRELRNTVGGTISIRAQGTRLATIIADRKTAVFDDVSQVKSPDFRFMARGVSSSLHIPFSAAAGTLNFWSAEPAAFPPQAVELLEKLAAEIESPGE